MFCNYQNLLIEIKDPFYLDKSQMTNFKIRYDKTNFFVS